MKKSIIAILLAAVMVLFCACGAAGTPADGGDKLTAPDAPAGWLKHTDGPINIYYPDTYVDITETSGVAFQVTDEATGNNINIVKDTTNTFDVDDLNDEYVNNILDTVTQQLDSIYESGLGVTCETVGKNDGLEIKTFGNGKCACIAYSVDMNVTDYATTLYMDFYQVIYSDDEASYTVTYTYMASAEGESAADYFADSIDLLFVD